MNPNLKIRLKKPELEPNQTWFDQKINGPNPKWPKPERTRTRNGPYPKKPEPELDLNLNPNPNLILKINMKKL